MKPPLLSGRGVSYAKKGEHELAIADFTTALQQNPEHAPTLAHRGNSFAAKGEHDLAIADFNKALTIDPEHVGALIGRGIARANKGDYDSAIADFNKTLAIDPAHKDALANRDIAYSKKGEQGKGSKMPGAAASKPQRALDEEIKGLSDDIKTRDQDRSDLLAKIKKLSKWLYGGAVALILALTTLPWEIRLQFGEFGSFSANIGDKTSSVTLFHLFPLVTAFTLVLGPYLLQLHFNHTDLERKKDELGRLQHADRAKAFDLPMESFEPRHKSSGIAGVWNMTAGRPPAGDAAE